MISIILRPIQDSKENSKYKKQKEVFYQLNKKGLIKISFTALLVAILLTSILFITVSKADKTILAKQKYQLDENIKIDLSHIKNYKLKIQTPSTSFLKFGSKEIVVFKAEEKGIYKLTLEYNNNTEHLSFEE
jgi:hypothetical protein